MKSITSDARRLLIELVNDAVIEVLDGTGDSYSTRAATRALTRLSNEVRHGRPGAQDLLDALAHDTLRTEIAQAVKRESRPIGITHDGVIIKAPRRIGVRGEHGYQQQLWTEVTPAQFMEFLNSQRTTRESLTRNLAVYDAIARTIADHLDAPTVAEACRRAGTNPETFDLTG